MSLRNPPVWKDGQFIRPNHFQQQMRYHDYVMRRRADAAASYQYGLELLDIDQEKLLHGHFSLIKASGIFPDGSVFDIPGETPPPPPLDIGEGGNIDQIVYLCLPLWSNGLPEILTEGCAPETARMKVISQETRDITSDNADSCEIEVGQMHLRLLMGKEDRSSYSCLPIARIQERRTDGSLVLDKRFMPAVYDIRAVPQMSRALEDITGLLKQRAFQIAQRLGGISQGGVADIADFMLLKTVNRLAPLFKHTENAGRVHPERLFALFVEAAGELSTFTHENRLPEDYPAYDHENPHLCFDPLIASLRSSLSIMLESSAVALPLTRHKYGVLTSPVNDSSIFTTCSFVLAAKADMPQDRLAKIFPSQVKISSIERIRELVQSHLPGVAIQLMATAPRQLPYHAEYTYFFLDHNSKGWESVMKSSGFAFHIAGDFPGLEMQFWAIRGRREQGNRV